MEYIKKKINNIKNHGIGCLCDLYRLEGYCKAKQYRIYREYKNLDYPARVTHITVYDNNNNIIENCYCSLDTFTIKGE